ncbi:hypothetical protein V1522DRAFT_418005 [Lipomyces starkeyi]
MIKVVILAPPRRIFLKSREVDENVEQMRLQWETRDHSEFGPLAFQGHRWLDKICEGFIGFQLRGSDDQAPRTTGS